MENARKFYIDGAWVDPIGQATLDIIDPATEQPFLSIAMGTATDAEKAIAAARAAFISFSET